jgi:hypothetical protein
VRSASFFIDFLFSLQPMTYYSWYYMHSLNKKLLILASNPGPSWCLVNGFLIAFWDSNLMETLLIALGSWPGSPWGWSQEVWEGVWRVLWEVAESQGWVRNLLLVLRIFIPFIKMDWMHFNFPAFRFHQVISACAWFSRYMKEHPDAGRQDDYEVSW